MQGLRIRGGRPLSGSIQVHGAKNSVLPILAATLLCAGVCVLHNCPDLTDVAAAVAILRHLGCTVERQGDTITVDARCVTCCDVPDALMREMRSSIIFLGAVLSRCGRAELSFPGGCELGPGPSTSTWVPCAPWGWRWTMPTAAFSARGGPGARS
jgi:UDP-N-acetylglucosamine 1-carboxyvinyltransferase